MNKNVPHKFAGLIHAWADGSPIEIYSESDSLWHRVSYPMWTEEDQYRIQPKKEYPETSLRDDDLCDIFQSGDFGTIESCRDVANAAIEHFIKNDMEDYLKDCNA